MGKKKQPIYRIVAADSRSPRDGRFIEEVGYYNPNSDPMDIQLKEKKVIHWINSGAQPTETVKSLFRREGLLHKIRLMKRGIEGEALIEEMQKFLNGKETKTKNEKARKLRRKETKKKTKEEKKEKPA